MRQVKADRSMMTEALKYRMQFTTKVGAVTNSRRHIYQFVRLYPCRIITNHCCAQSQDINQILSKGQSTSELLYTWLLNNLAKQFAVSALIVSKNV